MADLTLYDNYIKLLVDELVPAMGCTEPVALAYAAAKARETLGCIPQNVKVFVSGNIIKNVKSVVVPNTGGCRGIEAAVAIGIFGGDAEAQLEVISSVSDDAKIQARDYAMSGAISVSPAHNNKVFFIQVVASSNEDTASVTIEDTHTNITEVIKNDSAVFFDNSAVTRTTCNHTTYSDRDFLTVEGIIDFANSVAIPDVEGVITRQINFNSAISNEGLTNPWGAQIGRTLLKNNSEDIFTRVKAAAVAGSDARMSGCELPVIIVSGSGNQGMTTSLPVIEFAKQIGASREKLIRALVVSNLITIHQKSSIGRLSAFCGAVSAGCGAISGIAYLNDDDFSTIAHAIVNTLAIVSGMVCDGAKASCAAKIAIALDAAFLGYNMYKNGQEFVSGDGLVKKGVDNTIKTIGRMAREGMRDTDREILNIMTQK